MTTAAVMPAAVSTIDDLVTEHTTPTNSAMIIVKMIRMGSPYFLTVSVQQATTHDIAISSTERVIRAAVVPKMRLKVSLFIAHTQTRVVSTSCKLSREYTFLMNPRRASEARSPESSPL